MTLSRLARQLKINEAVVEEKASTLLISQQLRFVESELLKIAGKFGVSTLDEFDQKIASGQLKEENTLEDFFKFDHLLEQKTQLEKLLNEADIKNVKPNLWKSISSLVGWQKWNLGI